MATVIQRSMSAGEVHPGLYGRVDLAKYASGMRTLRNVMVEKFGGGKNRAGFQYLGTARNNAAVVRIWPFVFNTDQTYVLEFTDLYLRVWRYGALVESSPGVVYEVATPYAAADLRDLYFDQSADVLTICHASYAPRKLTRTGHAAWSFALWVTDPSIARPTGISGAGSAGATTQRYVVTANSTTNEESLAGLDATKSISSFGTAYTPPTLDVTITTGSAHGYSVGDTVYISGTVPPNIQNKPYVVTSVGSATDFNIQLQASSLGGSYSGGGTVARAEVVVGSVLAPASGSPITLTWTLVSGAKDYTVYRQQNGIYGFVGLASGNTFKDTGFTPDTSITPPIYNNPFEFAGQYPAVSGFIQQRLFFAASTSKPETTWGSRIGRYSNFSASSPIQDDDAVSFTAAGKRVNRVRHLADINRLLLLTEAAVWSVDGDATGVITPTAINLRQRAFVGSASQPAPIPVEDSILYVQDRTSAVRDLRYTFESDSYTGNDLSAFSSHLLQGHTVVAWAFAQVPDSVLWLVRDDGVLLGLTYERTQQVVAWHRHDTDGTFEDVAVVPEGAEDAVYAVVKRTIAGTDYRHIERLASRTVTDVTVDARFMDAFLTYDGRNASATTVTIAGGSSWTADEYVSATASTAIFSVGDVGKALRVWSGTDWTLLEITFYGSTTQVSGYLRQACPASLRGVAVTTWGRAVKTFTGLSHLNGKAVAVLADGNVVTNGLDAPLTTVSAGSITIDQFALVAHVGLPYTSDWETLDLDAADAETLQDKRKRVVSVSIKTKDSRGGWAGETDDEAAMNEWDERDGDDWTGAEALSSETHEVSLTSKWNTHGRVFIRQRDPLPLHILTIAPVIRIGGG